MWVTSCHASLVLSFVLSRSMTLKTLQFLLISRLNSGFPCFVVQARAKPRSWSKLVYEDIAWRVEALQVDRFSPLLHDMPKEDLKATLSRTRVLVGLLCVKLSRWMCLCGCGVIGPAVLSFSSHFLSVTQSRHDQNKSFTLKSLIKPLNR